MTPDTMTEILNALRVSQRWFERLVEDKDFADLDSSLCACLEKTNNLVKAAIVLAEKENLL